MKQPKSDKTRTVWVKCMVVDSDGFPVDRNGEVARNPWYTWDKRRRSVEWLENPKYRKMWKAITPIPKKRD